MSRNLKLWVTWTGDRLGAQNYYALCQHVASVQKLNDGNSIRICYQNVIGLKTKLTKLYLNCTNYNFNMIAVQISEKFPTAAIVDKIVL